MVERLAKISSIKIVTDRKTTSIEYWFDNKIIKKHGYSEVAWMLLFDGKLQEAFLDEPKTNIFSIIWSYYSKHPK
jgi:hypothetical protein